MIDYDTSRLERSCRDLVKTFQNQLTWEWDDRFEMALAAFDVKNKDRVHENIKNVMGGIWDDKNSQSAPEWVQTIIAHFGGIDPGQRLFTSDPDGDDIILSAWWPWGNGHTISIRMGVYVKSLSDEDNNELSRLSRSWFNL